MKRALKTLLLWLLIAVLPLHALAGGLGMTCAPIHLQSSQDTAVTRMATPDAVSGPHAHHGSEHASHGVSASEGEASPDADPNQAEQSHSSCSACSVFCIGAVAPPSTDLAIPAFEGSEAVVVAPAAFAVGFIQDGPQRPPRP